MRYLGKDEIFGYFDDMIDQITFWSLLSFGTFYAVLHAALAFGTTRLFRPNQNTAPLPISVIIAARNEEKNILRVLRSLMDQNYPKDRFEVIVVNDRSTDSTASTVETFRRSFPSVRLITIETNTGDMPHKKNALRTGIAESTFGILAFIDADCIAGKEWLNSISAEFTDEVGAVAGYSPYGDENSSSFLRYEENKNSLYAASAVGLGQAYMCTGRNFSYRKSLFTEVGGFEKIKQSISGDDDLFIQVVQRETKWKIRYMTNPASFVRTLPPLSFRQFVHQRTRHVSASSYYPNAIIAGYGTIHFFHGLIFIALFFSPLNGLLALMLKFNIDGAFIANGKRIFGEEFSLSEFVADEILLVLYSFLIAPLGFIGSFDWKGSSKS